MTLDSVFDVTTLHQLRETAVLPVVFVRPGMAKALPGWSHGVVSGVDPLRSQAFVSLLTESIPVGIVATRW